MPALLIQNRRIRSGRQCRLSLRLRGGESLPARLAKTTLADGRLFHLCAHGPQVVCSGDDREQSHEHATQGQQALDCCEPAPSRHTSAAAPQQKCRQCQQQPSEIEKQFHQSIHEVSKVYFVQLPASRPTQTIQNVKERLDVSFSERIIFRQRDLGVPQIVGCKFVLPNHSY